MEKKSAGELFSRLDEIVAVLRSPEGCPWDREQTLRTISPYLIEETFEAVEAIEEGDNALLKEELGDILLEVVLLARIASGEGSFTVEDSLESICEKLIRRHPHVFGGEKWNGPEELQRSWSRIKALEKPKRGLLEGVPRSLPALHRARRISEKAASVGFDWESAKGVLLKIREECEELTEAIEARDSNSAEEELGDILFAVVNLGRRLGVDAETALHRTTEKFASRFAYLEKILKDTGKSPADATLDEMENLWQEAKKAERE
ncbi:nucleoside triphosphate pyrophosphohydrolase [bacterium]|nr:MAG: nucleoside triphosphate pyrophosphohydrolase [bacterium]